MTTLDRAFEAESLLLGDLTGILTGSGDPAVTLEDAPPGSIYLRSNGSVYRKTGALANQWTQMDTAGSTKGSAVINFGAFASRKNEAVASVTGQAGVLADSPIQLHMPLTATADHNAHEHQACEVELRVGTITPGVGFDILARSRQGRDYGQFNVNWSF